MTFPFGVVGDVEVIGVEIAVGDGIEADEAVGPDVGVLFGGEVEAAG